MSEHTFDAVILDIDGTIWNTTGIVAVAWNHAVDKSGYAARKVVAQDLQKEFGKTMDVIAADLWPDLTEEQRCMLMSLCCKEEQLALDESTMDICYPGVRETVRELSAGNNFYVVSNCQAGYIELTLEKTGLAPYIKDFECYGRTGKGKAENLLLIKARNQMVAPLYVGDTQGDADACAQAGIPFVWASYGFGQKVSSCFERIDSFAELRRIVQL